MRVLVTGRDIHEWIDMPECPRRGDFLWLSSLTRGACDVPEAQIIKVEWAMEQMSGMVHPWVKVRRSHVANEAPATEDERYGRTG